MDELALLKGIPLFAEMSPEQLSHLVDMLEQRTYRKGQTILRSMC
jgi:signal-transduction protein with cAMP-binding, CBS, and nucleotidyltransferase domain